LVQINAIYNEAVWNTTATFDTEPKTLEYHQQWFLAHGPKNPIILAEREGVILGYSSLNSYSDRAAYESTVELSLYIHADYRGQGIGSALMERILAAGQEAGVHAVLSRIAEGNETSLRLHEKFGFWTVGTMREVGVKFGRLLDVHLLQKLL
jgi:L-amino acid N-acyltransferase